MTMIDEYAAARLVNIAHLSLESPALHFAQNNADRAELLERRKAELRKSG
jgi:hypothetical protein